VVTKRWAMGVLWLGLAASGCSEIDGVGFPAADDDDEDDEVALFDTARPRDPACVDEVEPDNDEYGDYLGQLVEGRTVSWCGRVATSGTSEYQFTGDLDFAYLELVGSGRVEVDVITGSAADWYVFLFRDEETYSGRGEGLSATLSPGYWFLEMASASGGTTDYEVRVTFD